MRFRAQVQHTSSEDEESKLILEIRAAGGCTAVHGRGRIAYRDKGLELFDKIADLLPHTRQLILELSGVEMINEDAVFAWRGQLARRRLATGST